MSVEQLVTDEAFISWVKNGANIDDLPRQYESTVPSIQQIEAAKELLGVFDFEQISTSTAHKERLWDNLHTKINKSDKPIKNYNWTRITLLLIIILSACFIAYMMMSATATEHTDYAEIKTVNFPDGSTAMLNANSSLSFDKSWDKSSVRRVFLKGEAYFNISHLDSNSPLIVSTDHVDIKVTGTRFVINSRSYGAQITLEEGQIKLKDKSSERELLTMKPGQTGFFDPKTSRFGIQNKEIDLYTSWKNGFYEFHNSSFSEVVRIVKENYGYEVRVEDDKMWDEELSGTIKATSINDLLLALEGILNTEIIVDKKYIHFK